MSYGSPSDCKWMPRAGHGRTMEDVEHCCVCLEFYSHIRLPTRLSKCGHIVCSSCLSTQAISACPLCRSELEPSTQLVGDEQLLLSIRKQLNTRMPSPTSFPIGLLDSEDAPGTPPYPSAPALVEIQPCLTDEEGPSRRGTSGSSTLHRSSASSSSAGSSVDLQHHHHSCQMGLQQCAVGADAPRASSSSTPSPTHGSEAAHPSVTERALIARTCTGAPSRGNTANHNNSSPTAAAATHGRGWRPRLPFSPRSNSLGSSAAGTPRSSLSISRHVSAPALSSAASTASQQALLSFPVDDIDPYQEEGWLQDSPRSWPMQEDCPGAPAAAAGAGTSRQRAGGSSRSRSRSRDKQGNGRTRSSSAYASTHAAVQAIVGGAVCVLQQLAVPWGGLLDQEGVRSGWQPGSTLPHSSVVVATVHSSVYCWASYTAALQHCLTACKAAQVQTQGVMEGLCRRVGLRGCGQLAWWWAATWLLGFLLYHWRLGLQLLPIAAASLALCAVAGMQPLSGPSSGGRGSNSNTSRQGAGAASSSRAAAGGSTSSGSGGSSDGWFLPVWPTQAAGGLLAADCCVLGLLLCVNQQTGLGSGPLIGLLAATPTLLAVVLLLLCAQVVVYVLCRGWWGHGELRHASLLCRCWVVAVAGVLAAGGISSSSGGSWFSTLAAAAAWVQKVHMLLVEGPVFVLYLSSLLQPAEGLQAAPAGAPCSSRPAAASTSHSGRTQLGAATNRLSAPANPAAVGAASPTASGGAASSGEGGASAVLCCLHFLLQLLVLLFVPPGPMAAAAWLPQHMQGFLVWGARVMLCGVAMQFVLRALGSTSDEAARSPYLAAGGSSAGGSAPLAGCERGGWSELNRSSCAGQQSMGHGGGSRCAAGMGSVPSPCQSQHCGSSSRGLGVSCCSSPSPRGRQGWELQLHAGHGNSSCGGRGCSSHGLWDADASCEGANSGSWALAAPSSGCGVAVGGLSVPGSLGSSPCAVGVSRLLWQHAPYLLLLLAAFAGDSFIVTAAAPASAAPVLLAIRMAWQRCLQYCMVAALCLEVAVAARREVMLLLRLPALLSSGNSSSSSSVFGVAGQRGAPMW